MQCPHPCYLGYSEVFVNLTTNVALQYSLVFMYLVRNVALGNIYKTLRGETLLFSI